MKKLQQILISLVLLFVSNYTYAITVAPGYDYDVFATDVVSSTGSFWDWQSSGADSPFVDDARLANSLTGTDAGTYVLGAETTSAVTLGFGDSIFNGSGADLALFFVGAGTQFSMSANGYTVDGISTSSTGYTVTDAFGTYSLEIALINLDNFNLSTNASISNISVLLGDASMPAFSLAAGINTGIAPVPVPAAIWLFLSGLSMMGFIRRKQK